jgi:hypothetical protein
MRVSLFFLILSFLSISLAEESFDQMNWNRIVSDILGGIWVTSFGEHFTPEYFTANVTREHRINVQANRLRARVGMRLMESLESSEIICQQDHFSIDVFILMEKELKQKGWDAHWIPKTLVEECGPQSKGFLYVKIKS